MSLDSVSSRTILYSCGYSCSVTGFERVVPMAILSEYQYIAKLNANPMARAMIAPWGPPSHAPTRTKSPPRAAMRTQVLTLFTCLPSFGLPGRPGNLLNEKDPRLQGEGLAGESSPPEPARYRAC